VNDKPNLLEHIKQIVGNSQDKPSDKGHEIQKCSKTIYRYRVQSNIILLRNQKEKRNFGRLFRNIQSNKKLQNTY
jgi:hypothetical protein